MPGMTPGRVPRKGDSPQRFTPRSSSKMPGQVRRALDGQILSSQRNGDSLEVTGGRLGVRAARGGGLKQTRNGLVVDQAQVGEKNHKPIDRMQDLASGATAAQIAAAHNALLAAMRKTGRMRG
jgi:hypothetical protein